MRSSTGWCRSPTSTASTPSPSSGHTRRRTRCRERCGGSTSCAPSSVSSRPPRANAYARGVANLPTADPVIAGAADPAGPEEVVALADLILRGAFSGDLGDALDRAAACARILAAGTLDDADASDVADPERASALTTRAARFASIAAELTQAARVVERAGASRLNLPGRSRVTPGSKFSRSERPFAVRRRPWTGARRAHAPGARARMFWSSVHAATRTLDQNMHARRRRGRAGGSRHECALPRGGAGLLRRRPDELRIRGLGLVDARAEHLTDGPATPSAVRRTRG